MLERLVGVILALVAAENVILHDCLHSRRIVVGVQQRGTVLAVLRITPSKKNKQNNRLAFFLEMGKSIYIMPPIVITL